MLKYRFQTARIAILGLLLAGLAFAQVPTRIHGTVIGLDGKPLKDAEIQFQRTDIKAEYKIKTNGKGEYDYPTLPKGTYQITVLVDGQPVAQIPPFQTSPAEARVVDINLQEAEQQRAAAQAAAAPAAAPAPSEELTAEKLRSIDPSTLSPEDRKKYDEQMAKLKEFEASIAEQEAAAKKDQNLQAAFNRGMQAIEDENWDVAVQGLSEASELDPKQVAVWGNLAIAYTNRGDKKNGEDRQADYMKAIEAYNAAIALKPEDGNLHNNVGVVMAKAGQYDESFAELTQAGTLNPGKGAGYFFNAGAVLFNRNQADPALRYFRQALELNDKYADAWYQLGSVLIAKASFDAKGNMIAPEGTREAFEKYLELAPTGPNVDAAKGMLQALDATIQTTITQ